MEELMERGITEGEDKMKLKIKHLYFNDEGWADVKTVLRQALRGNPDLNEFGGVLLTHEKNKDFADGHVSFRIEETEKIATQDDGSKGFLIASSVERKEYK